MRLPPREDRAKSPSPPPRAWLAAAFFLCAGTVTAQAQDLDLGGRIGSETRYFFTDGAYPGQLGHWQPSVLFEGELSWTSDDRQHAVEVKAFARVDAEDEQRTHGDLREAYYEYAADSGWFLRAGLAREFWGVTESRHLVDVINQVDALEDIDEEDRLGQPMVRLYLQKDWGDLKFYVLPGFRARQFPGEEGRVRLPFLIDEDAARYQSSAKRRHVDFAARYSHYFGSFDFGAAVFHGTSREPRVASLPAGQLAPVYDQMTQLSFDGQYTRGPWLWKVETIWRDTRADSFFASVAGVEHTFYQVLGSAADIGVIAEYQYDGREGGALDALLSAPAETAAPFTIADNDIFTGLRFALNDAHSSTLLIGASVDLDTGASLTIAEAERRIGAFWTVSLEARIFSGAENDAVSVFERDDFLSLELSRHF